MASAPCSGIAGWLWGSKVHSLPSPTPWSGRVAEEGRPMETRERHPIPLKCLAYRYRESTKGVRHPPVSHSCPSVIALGSCGKICRPEAVWRIRGREPRSASWRDRDLPAAIAGLLLSSGNPSTRRRLRGKYVTEPDAVAPRGKTAQAISDSVVRLMREYTGRGPTQAHTTINHDLRDRRPPGHAPEGREESRQRRTSRSRHADAAPVSRR